MIDFLAGVPGKLATLLSRVPSNNATLVANLDTTVSSRAAASTAVSNVDYTSARAGYLDKLNAGGIAGTVKSIQTGIVTTAFTSGGGSPPALDYYYKDITITSVNTAKCVVTAVMGNDNGHLLGRLTSSTNLRLTDVDGAGGICQWTVVEYY